MAASAFTTVAEVHLTPTPTKASTISFDDDITGDRTITSTTTITKTQMPTNTTDSMNHAGGVLTITPPNDDKDDNNTTTGSAHSTPKRKARRSSMRKTGQRKGGSGDREQCRRVAFSRSRSVSDCPHHLYRRSDSEHRAEGQSDPLCRVRSFRSTSKGLVRDGETFKSFHTKTFMSTGSVRVYKKPSLAGRSASVESTDSSLGGSSVAESYYRVCVFGAEGVGKTTLVNTFLANDGNSSPPKVFSEARPLTVSVQLDGQESLLEFLDCSLNNSKTSATPTPPSTKRASDALDPDLDLFLDLDLDLGLWQSDAYVAAFAINDQGTFTTAGRVLRRLRDHLGIDRPITLVGNKADLVRQRHVAHKDACALALRYGCKYIETSAELGHQTDELLVGMLRQIRLKLTTSQDDTFYDVSATSKKPPKWQKLAHLYRFLHGASRPADSCQDFCV